MKNLKENAERTREILKREQAPLSKQCEAVVIADLKKVLSGYFALTDLSFIIEKDEFYTIKITAQAKEIKPFGVIPF